LLTVAFSFPSYALLERDVLTRFYSEALPYFNSVSVQALSGWDGVKIRYRYFPANLPKPLGTVVVINGRSEFMTKYAELLFDLRNSGYAFVIYDHRGQGESDRMLADSRKGFVKNYIDYFTDLDWLMGKVVLPLSAGGNIYFLSHSMGGAISTAYLIQKPTHVKAMVSTSPMYEINLKIPETVAYALVTLVSEIGLDKSYVIGTGRDSWRGPSDPTQNKLSTSMPRYFYMRYLLEFNPEWIVSGPTFQWSEEAIRLGRFVRANANNLNTPLLVLNGAEDSIVRTEAHEQVVRAAPCAKLLTYLDARHEILIERDQVRDQAMQAFQEFLKAHP